MKLPLATGFLSGALFAADAASALRAGRGRYRMRVDRVFDRNAQPGLATEELSDDSYREGAPSDRWEVAIDGATIVLTEMAGLREGLGNGLGEAPSVVRTRLEGTEAWSTDGERRFHVGTDPHGHSGLFVLRGDEAELTLFGAGLPIAMSERGKLLTL